jgi:hypothetical protein
VADRLVRNPVATRLLSTLAEMRLPDGLTRRQVLLVRDLVGRWEHDRSATLVAVPNAHLATIDALVLELANKRGAGP